MVEINVPVATEAVPLGKVASPQAMTEGVNPQLLGIRKTVFEK